jgi:hypothetical protein
MRYPGILALLLVVAAPLAWAQHAYRPIEQRLSAEQLRETGLDTLTPAQLARLNQLLRDEADRAAAAVPPPAAGPTVQAFAGMDVALIRSRLKGRIGEWKPGTVFELENGQQWQVQKGYATLRAPLDAPPIMVVPGVAGRWFLQVHEDYPKARVVRIR